MGSRVKARFNVRVKVTVRFKVNVRVKVKVRVWVRTRVRSMMENNLRLPAKEGYGQG